MEGSVGEGRKYIVGWLTLKPGSRGEFLKGMRPLIAAARAEAGCLFFEMSESQDNPDGVLVMECFADGAAHTEHLKTKHFEATWELLGRLGVDGRFENVFANRVIPDSATFGGTAPAEVHPYE